MHILENSTTDVLSRVYYHKVLHTRNPKHPSSIHILLKNPQFRSINTFFTCFLASSVLMQGIKIEVLTSIAPHSTTIFTPSGARS